MLKNMRRESSFQSFSSFFSSFYNFYVMSRAYSRFRLSFNLIIDPSILNTRLKAVNLSELVISYYIGTEETAILSTLEAWCAVLEE